MTTIQKWGNSLAVRLPSGVMREQSLRAGTRVSVHAEDGCIVIREIEDRAPVRLSELVSKISAHNLHREVSWGKARGKEVW